MSENVEELFKKLEIKYKIISHEKIYTSQDGKDIDFKGAICCKNLFVKEQSGKNKGKLYLISLRIDKKAISSKLGISRLTFGSDDEMYENLGVRSGSASVLNVIKKSNPSVTYIIDNELLNYQRVAFHPNDNSMSILFDPKYIETILDKCNVKYIYLDF